MNLAEKFCLIAFFLIGYFALKYFAKVFLPFAFSFIGGALVFVDATHKGQNSEKTAGTRISCRFLLSVRFWHCFLVNGIISETEKLILALGSDGGAIGNKIANIIGFFEDIGSKIPFLDRFETIEGFENIRRTAGDAVNKFISDTAKSLQAQMTDTVGKLIKATPSFLVLILVCAMSLFFFSMDYDKIKSGVLRLMPEKVALRAKKYKNFAKHVAKRYFLAYLVLLLITFFIIFTGLVILGAPYALIMAFIIAGLDFLPL